MRTLLATVLVGASGLLALASPQQTPANTSGATFRSGVEVVELDVSVVDRDRRPVHGLTAADFTVFEDGQPQPVVAFKAVDLPDFRAFPASWMRDVAPDVVFNRVDAERVILLVLDDFHLSRDPRDAETARHIAREIVNEMGPLDMAGIVYTLASQNAQEFTTDRTRLLAAVNRFQSGSFPSFDGTPSGACQGGTCLTETLAQAANALNGWPGKRKTIALISPQPGFNIQLTNIEPNAFMNNVNGRDDAAELDRTFKALREAHTNVYQYDPRGITGNGLDANFGIFAGNTGGRSVTFSNEPWTRVPEMFIENNSYYMLGYQPSNTATDGRFRAISVRVNRPNVSVSARSGYYARDAKKLAKEAKKAPASVLDRAMTSLLPDGELPMSLSVAPFAAPGGTGASLVIVSGLDRPVDMNLKDVVDVAARAYDESRSDRRSKGVATAKIELTRRPSAQGVVHYDVSTRLDVAPGRYDVRLAMTSATAKLTGSAFASVIVPDFSKDPLTLSGVLLSRLPIRRPPGRDPLAGLVAVPATTSRAFARAERVGAFVRVYQGGKKAAVPVSISTTVVDQVDRNVFRQSIALPIIAFSGFDRATDYRMELPLARLPSGEYLLTIEANAGGASSRRDVRFKVR